LQPSEEAEYRIEFDKSALVQENEDRLTDRLIRQIRHGIITPNDARRRLGLEDYKGGDQYYMEKFVLPLGVVEEEKAWDMEEREDELVRQVQALQQAVDERLNKLEREVAEAKAEETDSGE